MTVRLFNSLTRRKEEVRTVEDGVVRFYCCGPTVYDYPHIGNYRTFLAEDLIRRLLEARGYEVRQVMNITDVGHMTEDDLRDSGEDKMAVAARRFDGDPYRAARYYEEAFRADLKTLNFRPADAYPRATEAVPAMIRLVTRLVESGHAYAVGGNVYFDVSTFPEYGKLSGNTVESLVAGARVEAREDKRHPADFALWKHDPKHIMKWDSPWGEGYPGWHLECSVMAMSELGEEIDIHAGGEDNRFPHHECEIAQAEAVTGKPFVRTWIHVTHLHVEGGGKMSKSEGNFLTLRDLLDGGHDPMAVRLALLSVQYRQPMNLTEESLADARKNLDRVRELVRRMEPVAGAPDRPALAAAAASARAEFDAAMDDDLNTSRARAALLALVADANRAGPPFSPADAGAVRSALAAMDDLLGVRLLETGEAADLDAEVAALIEERLQARSRRDFATADRIRDDLAARGILLTDGPEGTTWKRA